MTSADTSGSDEPTVVALDFDWEEDDSGEPGNPERPVSEPESVSDTVPPWETASVTEAGDTAEPAAVPASSDAPTGDEDVDPVEDLLEGFEDETSPVPAAEEPVAVIEAPPDEYEEPDEPEEPGDNEDTDADTPGLESDTDEPGDDHDTPDVSDDPDDPGSDLPVHPQFVYLPIVGDGAPVIDAQARDAQNLNDDTLTDLISSIGTIGVLEPILAEQIDESTVRLVAGERRLRACRWLVTNTPDNPHVAAGIPALVAPVPLTEEQRRSWQFNENFARQDLTLHETGAALLWMRCALLSQRLTTAGHSITADITEERDPVKRWAALEEFRVTVGAARIGAPWPDVVKALRVQMSPARAAKLVKAFSTLPEGIGTEMDANQISLHSRLKWLTLRHHNETKADEVWTTVRDTDPALLPAAVDAALQHPDASVDDVVVEATEVRDEANEARAAAAAATHAASGVRDEDDTATVEWVDASDAATAAITEGDVVIAQKVAKYAKPAADKMSRLMRELEDSDVVIEAAQAERLNTLCVQLLDAIEDQKRPKRRTVSF